jgi:glycerol-3-phosphate dehydrogenase (NAD(P)+)
MSYHFPMFDKHIAIIGAGSMGTALGKMLGENGYDVILWAYESEVAQEINNTRINKAFFPDFQLPKTVRATTSFAEALNGSNLVLSATPAQVLRKVWSEAGQHLLPEAKIVCASKGVETNTACLMSEVLAEVIPTGEKERLAFLSGPSFSKEIGENQPTAIVIASTAESLAKQIQQTLSSPTFRVYTTDDVIGVELGGALKNVIAIAVGVAEGMGLGHNSRAALITRGLAEVTRLAVACGANPLTLAGLAGVGDLVLTCTGHLSRNLQVGIRLGQGESLESILASARTVAEGVQTARSTIQLASKYHVEMPISETVVQLIDGHKAPKDAVHSLMTRKLKSEREH